MAFFGLFGRKKEIAPSINENLITITPEQAEINAHNQYILEQVKKSYNLSLDPRDPDYNFRVASAFASIYSKISETRKKLIIEVDRISQFYLVDVIVTHLSEDALAPEISTGLIINATSDDKIIQKEINYLDEKFGFDEIAASVAPDLIKYGEVTLSTVVNPSSSSTGKYIKNSDSVADKNFGLCELNDDVDQGTVVGISKYKDILGFLVQDKNGKVSLKEPADYVKFSLSSQKIKLDVFKEFGITSNNIPDALKKVPRYVRTGKSIIFPIISKLKELELLEALVPATKLSKLSNGSIIGVQVPTGYDVNQAMQAVKQIENLINKKISVDPKTQSISVENIMSTSGRCKVVPIFGDKGTLSKLDYKSDEPDDLLSSIDDIRRVILTSAGLPYEIIFDSDEKGNKGELLKKHARYLRKLKIIQKAIEEGIRQMIYIHLANKGISFNTEDIKVEFFNKLVEIDNLDKLEFMDTTIAMLKNQRDFVFELANKDSNPYFADRIKVNAFMEYLNEQFNVIGYNNIIDVDGDGKAEGTWDKLKEVV